jgi:hypothetical protein
MAIGTSVSRSSILSAVTVTSSTDAEADAGADGVVPPPACAWAVTGNSPSDTQADNAMCDARIMVPSPDGQAGSANLIRIGFLLFFKLTAAIGTR